MPLRPAVAKHLMGFGAAGPSSDPNLIILLLPPPPPPWLPWSRISCPAGRTLAKNTPLEWRWAAGLGNYMGWFGDAAAGVRVRLTGAAAGFESPQHILAEGELPVEWHNNGHGGVRVSKGAVLTAFGGGRTLAAGESLTFRFELLLTPCRPLAWKPHWEEHRYYQVGYPDTTLVQPEEIAARGARVINIHQGVDGLLNPYINYPFDRDASHRLSRYVSRAHALGMRVKIYYTIRELSVHAAELWALRSLGSEVLPDGEGGGDAWSHEHLLGNFRACWQNPLENGEFDAALCNNGLSRWANFYIEGLAAALRKEHAIDGIYYDGIAFGLDTMRRVRRTLQDGSARPLIDLHCGNNLLGDKYGKVSPALQFMHLFPYVDSLWFGEGYDYAESEDYWLVEISGIPFGLTGDMMRAGNPWRGMLFGMTTRYRTADPSALWRFFDAVGIGNATTRGFWEAEPPARTDCDRVHATAYILGRGRVLIAVASWAEHPSVDAHEGEAPALAPLRCRLVLDWAALGVSRRRARLSAPLIEGFQSEVAEMAAKDLAEGFVPVEAEKGWLLLLEG